MRADEYVPQRGDIVWVSMSPQVGHEQGGRRPAVALTPATYNGRTGLAVVCPVTSRVKGYVFERAIPDGLAVSGVVLIDQIRSIDWRGRKAEFACKAPDEFIAEIVEIVEELLSPSPNAAGSADLTDPGKRDA